MARLGRAQSFPPLLQHGPPPLVLVAEIGQVIETDLAQTMGRLKTLAVAQVVETNLAQAMGRLKTLLFGQVTETDLAQAVAVNPIRRLVTQVAETNLAQTITAVLAGAGAFLQAVRLDLAIRIRHGR